MGYSAILILAAVVALAAAAILKAVMRKKHPSKACAQCGKPSSNGYATMRESGTSEIVPLCVNCLLRRLDEDYTTYDGRAVVVQPVAELPCYVFRTVTSWSEPVRKDVESILADIETRCHACGEEARYAWVNALEPGPVAKLPEIGIKQTLLASAGAHVLALCAACTVKRIGNSVRTQEGGYLEICGPRGTENGVVSGMLY